MRQNWEDKWFLGGDFNDILERIEKVGGRMRHEYSFNCFKSVVKNMGMKDLRLKGQK